MKTYEYFTKNNEKEIYIECRYTSNQDYAVWENNSCVCDQLSKSQAIKLANACFREEA